MPRKPNPPGVLGNSPGLRRALEATERVGPTRRSVLIHGESGTGKERLARLVHEHSGRRGAFVAVNCATLVESLLESELFGHERGAFTGASTQKKGLFEAADGGTLFLDEIGDLPLPLQASMLRVLQEGRVRRVGSTRDVVVDVRVVAATHRDLGAMTASGDFRLDLFHRLAEYRIHLPPLRERGRDVVLLARKMLSDLAEGRRLHLGRDVEEVLLAYGWPGNIRELSNVLSQVALDVRGSRVRAGHLQAALPQPVQLPDQVALDEALVRLVDAQGPVRSVELREVHHLSRSSAQRRLQRLVAEGRLVRLGQGRATRYAVGDGLDERERVALELAAREGRVTRRALAQASGLSARTAGRVLHGLVEAGRLKQDAGQGRSSGYRLL